MERTEGRPLLRRMAREPFWTRCSKMFNLSLSVTIAVTVLSCMAELILRKVVAANMYNYRWFIVQFLALVGFMVMCVPCVWGRTRKELIAELRTISFRWFVWMALMDTLHSMLLNVGLGVIPGHLSVLIPQLIIPLTVFLSRVVGPMAQIPSASSFRFCCSFGGAFAIAGVMVAFLPLMLQYSECADGEGLTRAELAVNSILVFASVVPAIISQLSKESYLSRNRMNVYTLSCVTSLLQVLLGFVLAPAFLELQYVHAHETSQQSLSVVEELNNFEYGFKCLGGKDSLPLDVCEARSPVLLVEVLMYALAIGTSQIAIMELSRQMAMSQMQVQAMFQPSYQSQTAVAVVGKGPTLAAFISPSSLLHYCSVASIALAYIFFLTPFGENSVESDLLKTCSVDHAVAVVGGLAAIAGLLLVRYNEPQMEEEIDVWACMEEDMLGKNNSSDGGQPPPAPPALDNKVAPSRRGEAAYAQIGGDEDDDDDEDEKHDETANGPVAVRGSGHGQGSSRGSRGSEARPNGRRAAAERPVSSSLRESGMTLGGGLEEAKEALLPTGHQQEEMEPVLSHSLRDTEYFPPDVADAPHPRSKALPHTHDTSELMGVL